MAISRSGDGYVWHARRQQSDLVANSIDFVIYKSENPARENSDEVCEVFSGVSLAELVSIRSDFPEYGKGGDVSLSIGGIHAIYATLLSCSNWMASEEDFWNRLGFFRENAGRLAQGFLLALMRHDVLERRADQLEGPDAPGERG
ncbi:hypothetical protein [Nocardiopsis ganjiahuensis]|uniref:hypothetical protein n=1 Tax=Nocardiopsis ganjiahuensis TaxID=239984 RepID=UPI001267FAFC|nr:hypothetical protein [Nocardiopsis ganjiahuensis]